MPAIPLENTPASFPDVVALARRYHPLNVWNERIVPRLPRGVDLEKAYDVFVRAYGTALGQRRLKQGGSEIKLSGEETIALSPAFLQGDEPGLRGSYKGQRVESFLPMDKADQVSYLWAWWAWGRLPEDQRHPNTVQFLKRLEGSNNETITALLTFIVNPALYLSGDWSADFNRVYDAFEKQRGSKFNEEADKYNTLQTLSFLLRAFYPDGKHTASLRFMRMHAHRDEKKDFQTPQAVVGEWIEPTKLDLHKWDAALEPYGPTTGIPDWWFALSYRPHTRRVGDPAKWTKLVETNLEQVRKKDKLRRGTKAYDDFLIKALPSVADQLGGFIRKDNSEIIEDNQHQVEKWLTKEAVARRNIEKSLEQERAREAARRAFASFYGVRLPETQSEGSEDYTILLSILDALRREVVQAEPLTDDLTWDTVRKALQGVPEIKTLWSKIQWDNEFLIR